MGYTCVILCDHWGTPLFGIQLMMAVRVCVCVGGVCMSVSEFICVHVPEGVCVRG